MISPASLEGGGLRVVFTRRGDRYAHSIFRVTGVVATSEPEMDDPSTTTAELRASSGLLLESMEGTPNDDWPASPALRELHFEERADGRRLALLVGMAGKSHWSLSVELDAARGHLEFDVACRLRSPPVGLGSRYRVVSLTRSGAADRPIVPSPLAIVPIEGQSARLVVPADDQLLIEPLPLAGPWPRTARWRYVVRA